MIVSVTQDDIDHGIRGAACYQCPLALALSRAFGKPVAVFSACAKVGKQSLILPAVARRFLHDFDEGKSVQPFSFELNV